MDIANTLQEIITEYLGKSVEANEETTFDSLDLDSLGKVDLLMQIEDKFNITFDDDMNVNTIGELIAIIKKLQK